VLASASEQAAIAQLGLQAAIKETALARERYAVLTAASQFDVTNAINSIARARENLVSALYELNAAHVNFARATGSLNTLH
jgi:outer membrane protein